MPTVYVDDVDLSVDEFLDSCSIHEIKEVIEALVEDGHLHKTAIKNTLNNLGREEVIFVENIDKLREKYYTISAEDIEVLEKLFKKYI